MEILKVEDLCKTYGTGEAKVEAVKHVSFSMSRGEFGAVVGVSGSGKSTLLHCIGGLDTADSGKVFLNGRDLFVVTDHERTVVRGRAVGCFPLLLDYKKPDMDQVEEMLEVLGLENRRHHLPGQLSGGQQQRAAIGRALITRPALVLADEPTGNLDSKSSQDVMDLLLRASRHFKQTVLMITHNMNLTTSADRVFRVADGKLEELGGGQG